MADKTFNFQIKASEIFNNFEKLRDYTGEDNIFNLPQDLYAATSYAPNSLDSLKRLIESENTETQEIIINLNGRGNFGPNTITIPDGINKIIINSQGDYYESTTTTNIIEFNSTNTSTDITIYVNDLNFNKNRFITKQNNIKFIFNYCYFQTALFNIEMESGKRFYIVLQEGEYNKCKIEQPIIEGETSQINIQYLAVFYTKKAYDFNYCEFNIAISQNYHLANYTNYPYPVTQTTEEDIPKCSFKNCVFNMKTDGEISKGLYLIQNEIADKKICFDITDTFFNLDEYESSRPAFLQLMPSKSSLSTEKKVNIKRVTYSSVIESGEPYYLAKFLSNFVTIDDSKIFMPTYDSALTMGNPFYSNREPLDEEPLDEE